MDTYGTDFFVTFFIGTLGAILGFGVGVFWERSNNVIKKQKDIKKEKSDDKH